MKRMTPILFVVIFNASNSIYSQNWEIIQREPGVMITDICFLDDGLNGYAVGMNSVCFISTDEGWVAGNNGKIYHTQNGGTTWQDLCFGTDTYGCNSVFFVDLQHVWLSTERK